MRRASSVRGAAALVPLTVLGVPGVLCALGAIGAIGAIATHPAPGPGQATQVLGGELWGICTGNDVEPNGSLIRVAVDSGAVLERRVIVGPAGERLPNDFVFLDGGARILAAQLVNYPGEPTRTILQTIDTATATVLTSRTIDGWLDGLAKGPSGGKPWATYLTPNESQRRLVRVHPETGAVQILGALPPELFPRGLAFTPDGKELWALLGPNQPYPEGLLRLNPKNGEVLQQFPWKFADSPLALEFDASGRLVVYAYDGRLYGIDRATGAATLISTVANPIQHIVCGLERPAAAADRR